MAYTKLQDLNFYYETAGAGPPLLLFSQTGASGEYWRLKQVPYFSRRYLVIIHDYRGTGRTDRPAARYSTELFADDAAGILDAIGVTEPVHLLGHSMGGRVAQQFALKYPMRTRSLTLYASGSGPALRVREESVSVPQTATIPPELVARMVSLGWPGYHQEEVRGPSAFVDAPPDVVESYANAFRGEYGTDCASYVRHVIARSEHETTHRLRDIAAPTLVIVGDADRRSTWRETGEHFDDALLLAEAINDAELVILRRGAHAMHVELAEEFNEAVGDFLARH